MDWTDKTSVITNPSFETDNATDNLTTCGWGTDRVTGWTISPSSPGNAQVGVGNSSSTIQGIASSFSPSAGDKYFYMRENWNPNTTFSISQTIADGNIPAGIYRLTVKAAMFSSVASTYTLSLQEEGQTAATNSFSYAGTANSESWKDWSVMLIKQADGTDLTITAAYKTPSENSGGKHYCLLLDDVKLEYIAPTSVSSTNTLDITGLMANPSFELNTYTGTKDAASSIEQNAGGHQYATGWTYLIKETGWSNVQPTTAAPADGSYAVETWAGNPIEFKVYQNINNLIEGVYEISASARTEKTDANDIRTYAKVGSDDPMYSTPFDVSNIKNPWNGADNWQTLTARFSIIGGGDAEVGIHSTKFMQFDNFHLTYLGSDLLLSELKSSFSTKQTTATALLGNSDYDNVVGTERTTLNTKKSVTPEETVAGWTTAVNELQAAIDAFTAAKTNYDLLATEITKATALGMDASSYAATSSSTAASALTNTQNLKVAEYNYVTTTYQYGVSLGEWISTGTNTEAADFDNEHWSGTTHKYKNQYDSWGNPKQGYAASSWSINFSQDVTLPAGNYVFKVAGRQASGDKVTTSLVVKKGEDVLGTVSDFPRSNNSRGINKSGETAFEGDNEDFAHDGAGYGWEWRYVKFTLASDATVNIAVNSVATDYNQWVSFGDYTLQTDDDANIALITYNIALANAQTIIADGQYSNVTGSEKTALQAAIDADASLDKTDADAIEAATTTLSDATTAFTGAKSAYDTFVAAKAVEYPTLAYATTAKRTALDNAQAAAATSASDADTKKAAIQTAARQYYESHALAEGVDGAENKTTLITDPNFAGVTISEQTAGGWTFDQTGGSAQILSGESFTDGSGSSSYSYFDYYNNGANNQNIHQVISDLAPGRYMLTATARAHSNFSGNIQLYVTDKGSVNISAIGNSGGVFNRGWNDTSVEFYQTTTGDVTIGAKAINGKKEWWGVTRFRLVRLGDAYASVKIGATGWTTFASSNAVDLSDLDGATAYYASAVEDETVTMTSTEQDAVAAGQGIMLKGTAGATITVPYVLSGTPIEGNMLVGCTSEVTLSNSTENYANIYVLGIKSGTTDVAEFQNVKNYIDNAGGDPRTVVIPAGKAYLNATASNSGRGLRIVIGGDITGIDEAKASIEAVQKDGKFFKNGKLFIFKNGKKYNATGAQIK